MTFHRNKLTIVLTVLLLAGMADLATLRAADSPASQPAVAPAKAAKIEKLLVLTKTAEITVQGMHRMIALQRASGNKQVPPEFWDRFEAKLDVGVLIAQIIPVYDRHFTEEEIDGLIAFYQTPLGQKMVAKLPALTAESMKIGEIWGRKVGMQIAMELQQEAVDKAEKTPSPEK